MQKAKDYGQSRIICGSHWQSDVDAGEKVGAALYAALKNHREFVEAMNEAKDELRETKETTLKRTSPSTARNI